VVKLLVRVGHVLRSGQMTVLFQLFVRIALILSLYARLPP
jgi:hypothetical protein